MTTLKAILDSDNLVRLIGLADQDGNYQNAASVTLTLQDSSGVAVSGASGLPMAYISASNGNYQAQLEDTLIIDSTQTYKAVVVATSSGLKRTFRVDVQYSD